MRTQPSLTGIPPALDPGNLPDDPTELFLSWIRDAANAGVAEPHAATLATVDEEGAPDARTLILKDADGRGSRSRASALRGSCRPVDALRVDRLMRHRPLGHQSQPARRTLRVGMLGLRHRHRYA
ncbi:hypothetical protein B7R54_08615 [Subtercola boreus]|uniref:Pyridoxamine 5'-phosphate oxidase putative domain-containing protein n=1 Tax=Subtercola boreus TaxID=120213 RepID=A0A3E0VIG0_9MICO|nr:pyridoxamine 5'-phosphate oxidase family protein [Subtercola boreus]RFA09283.1 hypothetical protein B7R54_08615 [Subtercola boreus]